MIYYNCQNELIKTRHTAKNIVTLSTVQFEQLNLPILIGNFAFLTPLTDWIKLKLDSK